MRAQLRRYRVKPGQMEAFLRAWRGAVVLRGQYGFEVLASWRSEDDSQFGWLVAYTGAGSFEDAERAYYASPERAGLAQDPGQYLDHVETAMVETVPTGS